jgi:hypothetical protein
MTVRKSGTKIRAVRPSHDQNDGPTGDDLRFSDLLPLVEFVCWIAVLLCPILRLVNGPAVTTDQFAIHLAIFTMALGGGTALRLYRVLGSD